MKNLIIKDVDIRHRTKGFEYSALLVFDRNTLPVFGYEIVLPFYYQDWHRKLYLEIDYDINYFSINRNIPIPEIALILGD
jgi:hypothetical protein